MGRRRRDLIHKGVQPGARSRGIVYLEKDVAGGFQVGISASDDALNVVQLEVGHKRRSQSRVVASSIAPYRPARTRALFSMLSAVKPWYAAYQNGVTNWCVRLNRLKTCSLRAPPRIRKRVSG